MKRKKKGRKEKSRIRMEKVKQQVIGRPDIQIEFIFSDDAREVTAVKYYGKETAGYPLCPCCDFGVEREYQNYCEACGQRLLWNQFAKGNVTVKRLMGIE